MKENVKALKESISILLNINEMQLKQIHELHNDNIRLREGCGELKTDIQYERLQCIIKSQRFIINELTKKNEYLKEQLLQIK